MLAAVGESPVTSVNNLHPSAVQARTVLQRVNEEVQAHGWYFNKEYSRKLFANASGEVLLPSDALFFNPDTEYLVPRNGKLYDPVNHTTVLNRDVYGTLITKLTVDSLPPTAQAYVKAVAVYEFFIDEDGEGTKVQQLGARMQKSYENLVTEDLRFRRVSAKTNPIVLQVFRPGYGYSRNPNFPGGRRR